MDELTYLKNGLDIKTSKFLKKRKTCCKTSCLHCPYGFTLSKEGLKITKIDDESFFEAQSLIPKIENDYVANMLASSFGGNKKEEVLTKENQNNYLLVRLKDTICALIKINDKKIEKVYYQKHFEEQDISKEIIETYFFKFI